VLFFATQIERDAKKRSKFNKKKVISCLAGERYSFLKEKALEIQTLNQNACIVSIIRDLIEKHWQE